MVAADVKRRLILWLKSLMKIKQEVEKRRFSKGIVERLLGSKLHTENAEMPIRSSFVNYNQDDYGIIDAHYQALKEEVLHELGAYLLHNKSTNENDEMPIRASYVNHTPADTRILDGHYQKLKDEICHEIAQQVVGDKVAVEKDAMAIRASYLHELQEQGSLNEAIAKRLLAKGMSVLMLLRLCRCLRKVLLSCRKNRKKLQNAPITIKSLNVII